MFGRGWQFSERLEDYLSKNNRYRKYILERYAKNGVSFNSRFPELKEYLISDFELIANEYQRVYNYTEIETYAEISKVLKSSPKFHSISDLIGGITNNRCVGDYKHNLDYWKQPNRLEREAFAHFYEATLRNDAEKLKAIKEMFPNAYDVFEKMLEVIIS